MTALHEHLAVVPVVLPLAAGALMLALDEERHRLKAALNAASIAALIAACLALVVQADTGRVQVYAVGNWAPPFGIVLVVDRLSALMVLLAGALAAGALAFSLARWHRAGPRFHALLQFMLMGLNGAFLTGDLFNLFVFFELLLAASYGLALHGSGTRRVSASLHYIVVNLTASLLFLVGVALIYGVTGTLNMADLATRLPAVEAADRGLAQAGAAILGVAFLVKAGMWPLGFWLPGTYAAASAPAAALFAVLTKVGVYAVLRLSSLFPAGALDGGWLLAGGMVTLAFGLAGVLASQSLARLAGFSLLASSGTLLSVVAMGDARATGAALYYLVASTLGVGALFLLIELVERARPPGADMLAVTRAAFLGASDDRDPEDEDEAGVVIPATMALLGLSFVGCALLVAGLPPLPGFVAKFAMLASLLALDPVPGAAWALLVLLTLSGLASIIAMGRAGVQVFWASPALSVPRVRVIEMAPVALLLGLCLALTLQAGPAMRYAQDAAQALHALRAHAEGAIRRP
jgi:multicomponent K+:H+ antiporter subunit D